MAPQTDTKKRLALAIIDFLNTSLKDGTIPTDDAESVEVATQGIADSFGVDPSDEAAMTDAIGNQSLVQIYSVYEKLMKNKTGGGAAAPASAAGTSAAGPSAAAGGTAASSTPDPEAEKLKGEGNKAMQAKNYVSAVDFYTKALALTPGNSIYLSNRAAAQSAQGNHDEAAADAEAAVAADPKYTKAWSRLGLARFALGDAKGSMEAYKMGIDAEGNGGSDAMKRGYETAKKRVEEQEGTAAAREVDEEVDSGVRGVPGATSGGGGGAGGAGGMPDLSALAGMFGGGGGGGRGGGGGGGMPDLSSIMSNPMFANMAQQVMQNPDMMNNLMSNPRIRQMAESLGGGAGGGAGGAGGGGGGGMPDLSAMMQDPSIAEMDDLFETNH